MSDTSKSYRHYRNSESIPLFLPPDWKWDVFGDGSLIVQSSSLKPTLYRRVISWLVLGSKWTRLDWSGKEQT